MRCEESTHFAKPASSLHNHQNGRRSCLNEWTQVLASLCITTRISPYSPEERDGSCRRSLGPVAILVASESLFIVVEEKKYSLAQARRGRSSTHAPRYRGCPCEFSPQTAGHRFHNDNSQRRSDSQSGIPRVQDNSSERKSDLDSVLLSPCSG